MPVGLVCPSCGTPTTYHQPPVTQCPRCQQPYPESLRQSAEASLAAQLAPRPLLLTIGLYGAPGFGALIALSLLGALSGSGTFTLNGEVVEPSEFLAAAGVPFATLALLCFLIGYSIWKERAWSRWVIVAFWADEIALGLGLALGLGDAFSVSQALISGSPPLVFSAWYLFGKDNVAAYYRGLELRARAGHASVGDA